MNMLQIRGRFEAPCARLQEPCRPEQALRRCGCRSSGDRDHREGWRNRAPCGAIGVRPCHRTQLRRRACRSAHAAVLTRVLTGLSQRCSTRLKENENQREQSCELVHFSPPRRMVRSMRMIRFTMCRPVEQMFPPNARINTLAPEVCPCPPLRSYRMEFDRFWRQTNRAA